MFDAMQITTKLTDPFDFSYVDIMVEAKHLKEHWDGVKSWEGLRIQNAGDEDEIEILFIPEDKGAFVAHGAKAEWGEAASMQDVIDEINTPGCTWGKRKPIYW